MRFTVYRSFSTVSRDYLRTVKKYNCHCVRMRVRCLGRRDIQIARNERQKSNAGKKLARFINSLNPCTASHSADCRTQSSRRHNTNTKSITKQTAAAATPVFRFANTTPLRSPYFLFAKQNDPLLQVVVIALLYKCFRYY